MIHPTVAIGKRGDFRRVESGSKIFCKYERLIVQTESTNIYD